MSDDLMEQVENRVNPDLRHQFRSFNSRVKKSKKSWSVSTLKWFSIYSIGFIACLWAFMTESGYTKLWIGIVVTLGVSMVIVVSILFTENTRVANSPKRRSQIYHYVNALIFIGIAVAAGFVGWIGGTAMIKLVEQAVNKFISL